jgi:hypothetical protein
MLARALHGVLPDLTANEASEVRAISSAAGLERGSSARPPLRMPHHDLTVAGLIGGGPGGIPGGVIPGIGPPIIGPISPIMFAIVVCARSCAGLRPGTNLSRPNQRKTVPSATRRAGTADAARAIREGDKLLFSSFAPNPV